jgi:exosortase F-associated protein
MTWALMGRMQVKKASLILLAVVLLATAYFFQDVNWLAAIASRFPVQSGFHPFVFFVFNKTLRLIINDLACMILIYAIFRETRYLSLAFWLFLAELFIILPLYFFFKLSIEGDSEISSPLFSQIHRLIVNPTLMLLLMLGFFYQRQLQRHAQRHRQRHLTDL